jgi:hypothetical protein
LHAGSQAALLRAGADSVALQLPMEKGDGLLLNGIPCQSGVVSAYTGGSEFLWANPRHSYFAALVLSFEEVEELLSIRVQRLSIPSSRASGDRTVHCQHRPL